MEVQPSIVIHWNTVSIANPILSNEVMPKLGPSHFSKHSDKLLSHTKLPGWATDALSELHGVANSPSVRISSRQTKIRFTNLFPISILLVATLVASLHYKQLYNQYLLALN